MSTDLKKHFIEGPLEDFAALHVSMAQETFGRNVDIKLANACASSFYHLHEHVYHSDKSISEQFSSAKQYELKIFDRFPKFILVRDIANCYKHKVLTRSRPPALISNASHIEECVVATRYEDNKGIYIHASKGLYATLDDGSEENIYHLLKVAHFFWMYEFYFLGYFNAPPVPPAQKSEKPQRKSDSMATNQGLRITRGVDTTLKFRFLTCVPSEMNANTNKPSKINAGIELRIESPIGTGNAKQA
jgi:hypothetical protein